MGLWGGVDTFLWLICHNFLSVISLLKWCVFLTYIYYWHACLTHLYGLPWKTIFSLKVNKNFTPSFSDKYKSEALRDWGLISEFHVAGNKYLETSGPSGLSYYSFPWTSHIAHHDFVSLLFSLSKKNIFLPLLLCLLNSFYILKNIKNILLIKLFGFNISYLAVLIMLMWQYEICTTLFTVY